MSTQTQASLLVSLELVEVYVKMLDGLTDLEIITFDEEVLEIE